MKPPEAIKWLTELLLPVMRYRVDALGPDASGAFNFYCSRLATGRVFSDYEMQLVEHIIQKFPAIDEIHEVGCGWGQLVFMLAWSGYRATGFEIDCRRYLGAEYFYKVLAAVDHDRAERAQIRYEFFPPLDRPQGSRSLVISTNIIVSNAELVEPQVIWALRRYRYAIVDVDHFCRPRRPNQRDELIATIEQAGMKSHGALFDAAGEARFHLFAADCSNPA